MHSFPNRLSAVAAVPGQEMKLYISRWYKGMYIHIQCMNDELARLIVQMYEWYGSIENHHAIGWQ